MKYFQFFFWPNMIKYRNLVELQKFYPEEHWKMGENLSFIVIYLPDKRQNECPATSRIFSLARWTMPGHRRARSRPCYVEWFSGNRVYLVPFVLQNLAWVALKGLLDFSRDQLLSRKIKPVSVSMGPLSKDSTKWSKTPGKSWVPIEHVQTFILVIIAQIIQHNNCAVPSITDNLIWAVGEAIRMILIKWQISFSKDSPKQLEIGLRKWLSR